MFEVPREYEVLGGSSENTMRMNNQDEEEIMLQYAIRQSLGETEQAIKASMSETTNPRSGSELVLANTGAGEQEEDLKGETRQSLVCCSLVT